MSPQFRVSSREICPKVFLTLFSGVEVRGAWPLPPRSKRIFLRIYIRLSRKRHLHHIRLSSLLHIWYSSMYHADLSSLYHNNTYQCIARIRICCPQRAPPFLKDFWTSTPPGLVVPTSKWVGVPYTRDRCLHRFLCDRATNCVATNYDDKC